MDVAYYIEVLVFKFDIDKIIIGRPTINFPRLIFKQNSWILKIKNVTFQFYISKNHDSKFQL